MNTPHRTSPAGASLTQLASVSSASVLRNPIVMKKQDQKPSEPTPADSHINLESSPSDSPPHSPLSSTTSSLSDASPPPSTHLPPPGCDSPLSYALTHDSPPPSQQLEPNPPQAIVSYSNAIPRVPERPAPSPPAGSHLKLKTLLSDSSSDSPLSQASSPSPPVPNGRADGRVPDNKKAGFSILRNLKREGSMRKALLAFRISSSIFCLISFSVMAADIDRGWALDSFYRYTELRYCMAVNVIGFVYSGIQAFDLAMRMTTAKYTAARFRYYLDFVLDQMLTYVLVSASSSASVRIDEWQSNWGKDKFPEMATASVGLSFVAFTALALSSFVSGYFLSTLSPT